MPLGNKWGMNVTKVFLGAIKRFTAHQTTGWGTGEWATSESRKPGNEWSSIIDPWEKIEKLSGERIMNLEKKEIVPSSG